MKKFLYFVLCAALAFTACNQEELAGPDALVGNVITLKATHEAAGIQGASEGSSVQSRTALSGSSVLWSAGDIIKLVWNGSDAVSSPLAADGSSATFEVEIQDAVTPVYAVYPSTVATAYDGSTFTVTVPATQSGCTFGSAAIELAEYNGGDLSFKHLCGLLKVTVPDHSPAIAKVVIRAYGDKTIAGDATVAFSAGLPVVSSVATPSSSVTLNVAGAGTYYAALLPADLEEGFFVEILDSSDNVIGQKFTGKKLDLKRRDVANLGSIAANAISGTFVTVSGAGLKDGSSWDNALDWTGFRNGIGSSGSLSGNIFMAGGTYTQTTTAGTSIREAAVFSVYGGYDPASTGTDLSKRNISTYATVFDGNNTCRLVVWNASGIETLFDGITFQNASRSNNDSGSALILQAGANARFNNCIFVNNSNKGTDVAKAGGGAVRVVIPSSFTNCTFSGNTSSRRGGVVVTNTGSQTVTFSKCTFNGNTAGTADGYYQGGAIYIRGGNVVLDDCVFENNTALRGSAIYADNAAYLLKADKCYFYNNNSSNKSASTGGAVWADLSTGKMYFNACSFYKNYTGSYGSAIGNKGTVCINNCSFQENQNGNTTGAANYFTNNGKTLIVNSTFRMAGASAVALWAAGGKVTLVNSILVNNHGTATKDSNNGYALKTGSGSTDGSMVYSYGHNVCSKFLQATDVSGKDTYELEDGNHPDALLYKLAQSWNATYRCPVWSKWHEVWDNTDGAPEGFSLTNTSYITSVISAFDSANSTDFGSWLSSITTEGGTALNSDIRGKARSAGTWPGCYDNGANITL